MSTCALRLNRWQDLRLQLLLWLPLLLAGPAACSQPQTYTSMPSAGCHVKRWCRGGARGKPPFLVEFFRALSNPPWLRLLPPSAPDDGRSSLSMFAAFRLRPLEQQLGLVCEARCELPSRQGPQELLDPGQRLWVRQANGCDWLLGCQLLLHFLEAAPSFHQLCVCTALRLQCCLHTLRAHLEDGCPHDPGTR